MQPNGNEMEKTNQLHNEIKEEEREKASILPKHFLQRCPESVLEACRVGFSPALETVCTEILQRRFLQLLLVSNLQAASLLMEGSFGNDAVCAAKMQTTQSLRGKNTNINK